MTDASSHTKPAVSLRVALLSIAAVLVFSLPVLWIVVERQAAEREYVSYESLCAMGATGDDWVSFREVITGRPPIVQLKIPTNIAPQITFGNLPNLKNLRDLTLAYPSLSVDQLQTIQRLRLDSLRFQGRFPREPDVPELACLRGVRFLSIPSNNLSIPAQSKLRSLLPSARIDFE